MGRFKTVFPLLIVLLFLLSGCGNILAEPDHLITPPTMNTAQFKERKVITSMLGEDEHIIAPREMKEPAPSVNIDIDADGTMEKLVFWEKNNGYQAGITLLQQMSDGHWYVLDQKKYSGRSIIYYENADIDGDGKKEVLIGVDIGGYNTLFLYKMSPDGLQEMDNINYSFLTLVPSGKDHVMDLVTSISTTVAGISSTDLNVYRGTHHRMKRFYHQSYDGYCQEMNFGRIYQDQKGLYLALSSDFNTTTMLLLAFDGHTFKEKLRKDSIYLNALAERREGLIQDINKDGQLDILTVQPPLDASRSESREFLQVWQTWDGKSSMNPIYSIIENKRDGYQFRVPSSWVSNLRYQYVMEDQQSILHFYEAPNNQTIPVFSIISRTLEKHEDLSKLEQQYIVLGTSPANQRVYLAKIHKDHFANETLNADLLRGSLKIEGGL